LTNATIGKFEIQVRLSRGGMADVYRCCLRGIGGFEKVVVVKRIRAERASDPDFVNMFLDEARLAANLDHPNIVQVFEIDEANGNPYIAMEYVKGPTMAALVRQAHQRERLEIGHVCKVLAGVCAGLHYAHTAVGPDGAPLGLVHRDVSPQNVIVSRQGVPKLLDFGVAKANGRLTETLSGTLKGKLRYLSPEQLCRTVDPRADVFAVGVCLFEATTGQSPYGAAIADDLTLLDRISRGQLARPSDVVAGYPPALEEIVLAATDPTPERRCPSAQALHDRLEAFVAAGPYASSTRAVAAWVDELFPAAGEEVEEAADDPVQLETLAESLTPVPTRRLDPGRHAAPRPSRLRWWHLGVLAGGALGLAVAAAFFWWPAPPAPPVALRAPAPAPAPATCGWKPPREERRQAQRLYGPPADGLTAPRRRRQGRPPEPSALAAMPARTAAMPAEPAGEPELDLPSGAGGSIGALPALAARAPTEAAPEVKDDPRPAAVAAPPPPRRERAAGEVYSVRPRATVPRPALPRMTTVRGEDDLQRIFTAVEQETLEAGCSPDFSRGITSGLARALAGQRSAEVYPAAMYYFIVNQAALGREKRVAEQELRRAQGTGILRALMTRLPGDDR
jgi:tRNA A-37 threonylcarbamoyl transferase component Bud32